MSPGSWEDRAEDSSGLIRALTVLRERWWVVLIATIVCVGVATGLTLRETKQYTATARLHFGTNPLITEVGGSAPATSADPQADQATNILLVTTTDVADAVKKSLGLQMSAADLLSQVTATNDQSSNIVAVSATDPSPTRAARIANAFVIQYVATSKDANVRQVRNSEQVITAQLQSLPQTPANANQRASLQSSLQRLQLLEAVQTGDADIVDMASVPTSPSSPNLKVNLLVALIFGLGLGIGLAFLLNLLDRRLKTVDDFEELYGMPSLAMIPSLHGRDLGLFDPRTVEQFLILRTSLSLLAPAREVRVVLVTSAVPGEGKTTVAIGLARAAASSGQNVVLIETDFKRPVLAERLGLVEHSAGLSATLIAGTDPQLAMRPVVSDFPNLHVITSGRQPPNSAALLRSVEMANLLDRLSEYADLIVLDAPPLLPVADAQALLTLPQVDSCLIVGRMNFTKRDETRYARRRLDRIKLSGLGLVVNDVRQLAGGDDYYGPLPPDESAPNGTTPQRKVPLPGRRTGPAA